MKLYHHPMSQNCRRVVATVHELQRDDIELVQVDLMQGAHQRPEFLAINPNGKVPVLVDGDFTLWESVAISQYLAQGSPLIPQGQAAFDVLRWQLWGQLHLGRAVSAVVYERLLKPMLKLGQPDEAAIDQGTKDFRRFAAVLEGQLDGGPFVLGQSFTLADLSLGADLGYAGPAELPVADFPRMAAWYGALDQRDSWRRSAPPPPQG